MMPQMISLLQAASLGRKDLPLATFDEAQIRWAVKTGLGPLLFQTTKADPEASRSRLWPLLQAADLTARVLTGEQLDAMGEIIDVCEARIPPLTLLKGISICDQYYPEPHFRTMRDIDFLVEEADIPTVEAILSKLGYSQRSNNPPESYSKHHHTMPLFHSRKGVWVEIHRGLFPPNSKVGTGSVFTLESLKTHLRPSEFRGRKVTRLSNELQIVYTASHWANDFKVVGGMVAMLDVIYLLKNTKARIDWEKILSWMDGSVASAYVYLLLSYLHQYELINVEPEVLRELSLNGGSFGRVNLKTLYRLIDDYLVEGRSRGFFFSLRNLDIVWKTCLLPGISICNLMLVPVFLLMPFRLRKSVLA